MREPSPGLTADIRASAVKASFVTCGWSAARPNVAANLLHSSPNALVPWHRYLHTSGRTRKRARVRHSRPRPPCTGARTASTKSHLTIVRAPRCEDAGRPRLARFRGRASTSISVTAPSARFRVAAQRHARAPPRAQALPPPKALPHLHPGSSIEVINAIRRRNGASSSQRPRCANPRPWDTATWQTPAPRHACTVSARALDDLAAFSAERNPKAIPAPCKIGYHLQMQLFEGHGQPGEYQNP